jgi:hypothetical protein
VVRRGKREPERDCSRGQERIKSRNDNKISTRLVDEKKGRRKDCKDSYGILGTMTGGRSYGSSPDVERLVIERL